MNKTRNPGRSSSFIRRFGRPVNLGSIQLTVCSNERRKYLLMQLERFSKGKKIAIKDDLHF